MKKLLKKLAAIVTMAAVTLTMAVAIPTPASADSIYDTAKAISSGKQVSTTIYYDDNADYKINVTQNGLLELNITSMINQLNITVYDSIGYVIDSCTHNILSGKFHSFYETEYLTWNDITEQIKGIVNYQVQKGIYYIRFQRKYGGGGDKLTFTATYPSSTSTTKVKYITINLPKGSTLSLGADTTGSGAVTWKSSKSKVATVSSTGTVTAKAKGSTIITAKSGKSSKKIKIVVS